MLIDECLISLNNMPTKCIILQLLSLKKVLIVFTSPLVVQYIAEILSNPTIRQYCIGLGVFVDFGLDPLVFSDIHYMLTVRF